MFIIKNLGRKSPKGIFYLLIVYHFEFSSFLSQDPAVISLQSEDPPFASCRAYVLTNSLKCPFISVSFLKDISSAPRILIDIFSLSGVTPLCLGSGTPLRCACGQPLSCVPLCDPTECSPPGPSVHGFSGQEYWSGLPRPPPGDLPNPGIEPGSPALQEDSLPSEHQGSQMLTKSLFPCLECLIFLFLLSRTCSVIFALMSLTMICISMTANIFLLELFPCIMNQ